MEGQSCPHGFDVMTETTLLSPTALSAAACLPTMAPPGDKYAGIVDFDPEALRRRYLQERDKRLRGDGGEQYLDVTEHENLKHFAGDVAEKVPRGALNEETTAISEENREN